MIVIIRNAPDTSEGKRGIKLARDTSADIVLLQNGVYFMQEKKLKDLGFVGTAYVLEDDKRLRGLKDYGEHNKIIDISYDGLVDLMAETDKVIGMF